jgi:hypothetical protein
MGFVLHRRKAFQAVGGGGTGITVSEPVIRWTGTPADNVDITSASFTPANNSLLVVCVCGDTASASDITVSVSGGSLTWTKRAEERKRRE